MNEKISKRLAGKVAVITGASKGIGAGIAEKFACEGAAVVVNYNTDANGANKIVAQIKEQEGKAIAVQGNVGNANAAKSIVEAAIKEFGALDILVNNAGTFDFKPLEQITEEHYYRQFDTNVKGLLFMTQAAVHTFGERGGKIINISSMSAEYPQAFSSVYSATKGAVNSITRVFAVELGSKKINVNAISPGATETEGATAELTPKFAEYLISRTPFSRLGTPQDVANLAAFLASDEADWITGQIIEASGGLRL